MELSVNKFYIIIIVNDEWYQFQTSDAPTGGELRVTVPITTIGPGEYDCYDNDNEERPPMNQLNVVIFTTIRDDGPPESWRCLQNYDSSKKEYICKEVYYRPRN